MRFSFVGKLQLNDESAKVPFVRSGKTKNGNKYKSFSCGVKAADNNMAWNVELFGMDSDPIKTKDSNGKDIQIERSDRFDKDVISDVASYRKNIIKIDDDRKEYISSYDAVEYLVEHEADLKNGRYRITGQVSKDFYEGKQRDRFQIQNVYQLAEDDDSKNELTCTTIYYLTKDAIDTADWNDEKKIIIDGYISTYISDEKKNMYVNQQIIFDASKINFENENHVNLLKFRLKMFGCELTDDNKIKVNLKSGKVYSINAILRYSNGAEAEEVTMDMLSETQKEAIQLGLKTLDDFKGNVYGARVTVYRLVDFTLKDDYEDGIKDEDMKFSEFEEDIYVASTLSSSDSKKKSKDVEVDLDKEDEGDEELEDLFG